MSTNTPLPSTATKLWEQLVQAKSGDKATVHTAEGPLVWTRLDNDDWQGSYGGKPWETQELAALLNTMGGRQTLETF